MFDENEVVITINKINDYDWLVYATIYSHCQRFEVTTEIMKTESERFARAYIRRLQIVFPNAKVEELNA